MNYTPYFEIFRRSETRLCVCLCVWLCVCRYQCFKVFRYLCVFVTVCVNADLIKSLPSLVQKLELWNREWPLMGLVDANLMTCHDQKTCFFSSSCHDTIWARSGRGAQRLRVA